MAQGLTLQNTHIYNRIRPYLFVFSWRYKVHAKN